MPGASQCHRMRVCQRLCVDQKGQIIRSGLPPRQGLLELLTFLYLVYGSCCEPAPERFFFLQFNLLVLRLVIADETVLKLVQYGEAERPVSIMTRCGMR